MIDRLRMETMSLGYFLCHLNTSKGDIVIAINNHLHVVQAMVNILQNGIMHFSELLVNCRFQLHSILCISSICAKDIFMRPGKFRLGQNNVKFYL